MEWILAIAGVTVVLVAMKEMIGAIWGELFLLFKNLF